jgi:excisionase family DNA binding protein
MCEITIQELAKLSGCRESEIRKQIANNKIKMRRSGRQFVTDRTIALKVLESAKARST